MCLLIETQDNEATSTVSASTQAESKSILLLHEAQANANSLGFSIPTHRTIIQSERIDSYSAASNIYLKYLLIQRQNSSLSTAWKKKKYSMEKLLRPLPLRKVVHKRVQRSTIHG